MRIQAGYMITAGFAAAAALSSCTHRYGSVSEEGVQEALDSPKLALTPHEPGWLLEGKQVYLLNDDTVARVRSILSPERVRSVPEDYYRDEETGNRDDDSELLFYLYASNAQALGGRVVGQQVLMDDFVLSDQEKSELYTLFLPFLHHLFPNRIPAPSAPEKR